MIFSTTVVISLLALLPSSLALAIDTRKTDCSFVCPGKDTYGHGLSRSNGGDGTISCSYSGGSGNSCIYNVVSGALVGNKAGCPKTAVQQCSVRPKRQGSPSPNRAPPPSPSPSPNPSPNPSDGKNGSQPSKEQPCNYKCPQKDLAKIPVTGDAIHDSILGCSYSTEGCKYDTKTGLLVEDNNEGKCPQTATPFKSSDRRYI